MNYINYALIIIGAVIAIYFKAGKEQNQGLLILGIVLLMIGIYRISKRIPDKKDTNENFDPTEKDAL